MKDCKRRGKENIKECKEKETLKECKGKRRILRSVKGKRKYKGV